MANTYPTTQFPLGSTEVKVLFNNASNFDDAMNSELPSFYDRFNKRRETWAGMQKMVTDFLEAMGFEPTHLVYVDGTPLTVLRPTQLIDRAGSVYKVKMPASFPVNLTGNWATDQLLLVDVGDASLRASLSAPTGAQLVGGASVTVPTIAALRALSTEEASTWATVQNDKFTSHYRLDSGDNTSPDDGGAIIAPTIGLGRWKLNHNGQVSIDQYGAVGDGATDDTLRIQAALDYGVASGTTIICGARTYGLTLAQNIAIEGFAMSWCALVAKTGMKLFGAGMGRTTFKLLDNQSTVGSPKWFSMIVGNTVIKNLELRDITLDLNGQNNKINDGTWPGFQCAGLLISGSVASVGVDARLIDSIIDRVEVKNSPGVTAISTGVRYGHPGIPSRNVVISRCKFLNNGIDSRDHSSIFCFGDGTLVTSCDFDFEGLNGGQNGPIVAVEMHGNDNQLIANRVRNYLQLAWIGAGDEGTRSNIVIADNVAEVAWWGVGLYADPVLHQNLESITIENNAIHITGVTITTPNLTGPKYGFYMALGYGSNALRVNVNNNVMYCTDRVSNAGFYVAGAAGSLIQAINIGANIFSGFSIGGLLGAAPGSIATCKVQGNIIENCAASTLVNSSATRGLQYRDASSFSLNISNNMIGSGDVGEAPNIGIQLSGTVTNFYMDGNDTTDSVTSISNSIVATGFTNGDQALLGPTLPSSGSWKQGQFFKYSIPTEQGSAASKYVLLGWTRVTNGTGNALNVDWFESRALTGN